MASKIPGAAQVTNPGITEQSTLQVSHSLQTSRTRVRDLARRAQRG
jgi:hypothetical protein